MTKITITNAYTWDNKGDAGILLGTIETLKKVYNDKVEFNILSFTPEKDKKNYCKDEKIKGVYSNILNPHPYTHTKLGKIIAILKLILKLIKIQFLLKFNMDKSIQNIKELNIIKNSDLVIVCGGGFLGGKKLESLLHLYQIYINKRLGKVVYIMGTSIEPVKNRLVKYYTEKVLRNVDYIYARETITEKYLSEFMPKEKYMYIPDMAFMLPADNKAEYPFLEELKLKSKMIIGITAREWNFPNVKNIQKAKENYIEQLKEFIEYCIIEKGASFVFIPQVIVYYANDLDIAYFIREKLDEKCKEKFIIKDNDWTPSEIKGLIGKLDYFVGTRMHSNIFATSMCIPTLAIAYEKKTNGIMETVGQEAYIEEIDQINLDSLKIKFNKLIENNLTIKKELSKRKQNIESEILEKTKAIFKG